jgi:acetyltransferase
MLTEPEAKAVLAAYGIPVPETIVAATPEAAGEAAERLLGRWDRVVVKLLSKTITHKSDVGGVVLGVESSEAARRAAEGIVGKVVKVASLADVEGFAVQPMVTRRQAQELILGMSRDPIFGPVILFGAGGVAVEVMNDTAVALPPLDDVLAGDLIDRTRIGKLLAGFRDRKPADRAAIARALNGLSQMIVDFPCIVAADINPLLADADGVMALDARIEIAPAAVEEPGPNPALAIRPYPSGLESRFESSQAAYLIRPIRPADIALYPDFLGRTSPDDIRFRFLAPRKNFPDEMLKRLTQLDYERDMAFVALEAEGGDLAGIGRLSCDPDKETAEYALLIRTDVQGQGLGFALLARIIDYARREGVGTVEGIILADNRRMLAMARDFGFVVEHHPEEQGVYHAKLVLR